MREDEIVAALAEAGIVLEYVPENGIPREFTVIAMRRLFPEDGK